MSETQETEAGETLDVAVAELRPALEAILMVADQPLDEAVLASAVGYPVGEVADALGALAQEYDEADRGFELRNVAGGWRYYTREAYAPVVEAFVLDGQQARLTQAALETLAVVAYKQPVSRARVSAIRGVNVDGVMRTLLTAASSRRPAATGSTGRRCTARPCTSSSASGSPRSTSCPSSRPTSPRWTTSRTSSPRCPARTTPPAPAPGQPRDRPRH